MSQCTAKSKRSQERCKKDAMVGRDVCYFHGGKSPRGRAAANFKTGRYSKDFLESWSGWRLRYEQSREMPNLLSQRDEIAVLETLLAEQMQNIESAALMASAWSELQVEFQNLQDAIQAENDAAFRKSIRNFDDLIKRGYKSSKAREKVVKLIDNKRRVVESERKALVEQKQMLLASQVEILIGSVIESFRIAIAQNCELPQARTILDIASRDVEKLLNIEAP